MAHNIETIAWAGETPWHGLGTKVDAGLTPREMQVAAGLDWGVIKVPHFIKWQDSEYPTGVSSLIRDSDGSILESSVPDDWHVTQPDEAFEFFTEYCRGLGDEDALEMHTAGSLQEGRYIWALAKIKNAGFELFKKDRVESYLLFTSPHIYGKAIDVRFTPVRVVCNNTLTLALNGKTDTAVKVSHRKAFRAEEVKRTLGLASNRLEQYHEMAAFLAGKNFNEATVLEYFQEVFPSTTTKEGISENKVKVLSRPAQTAFNLLETQPGSEFGKGSWWQAFNAVTFATDHILGHSQETRLTSAWYGPNRNRKIEALKTAVKFAEAA